MARPKPLRVLDIPRFGSMKDMAAQCCIPYSILASASAAGAPFKDTHGRCDLIQFLEWFFSKGDKDDNDSVDWANRGKRATALIKEVDLEERRGEVVNFHAASMFIRSLVNVGFFGELDRMAHEFPASLKGKTEVEINEEVLRQIRLVKESLEKQLNTWEKKAAKKETK